MRLTATKRLRYLGVAYNAGDDFDAEGKWSDLLQRAKLARVSQTADEAPRRGRPKGSKNKPTPDTTATPDTTVTETDDE